MISTNNIQNDIHNDDKVDTLWCARYLEQTASTHARTLTLTQNTSIAHNACIAYTAHCELIYFLVYWEVCKWMCVCLVVLKLQSAVRCVAPALYISIIKPTIWHRTRYDYSNIYIDLYIFIRVYYINNFLNGCCCYCCYSGYHWLGLRVSSHAHWLREYLMLRYFWCVQYHNNIIRTMAK